MNVLEIHLIQTVPAANLNRDDAGFPKQVTFGGVPRIRLSSQSQKYAMRRRFREQFDRSKLGVRTRQLARALTEHLPDVELGILEEALELVGFKLKKGVLDTLVFLSWGQVEELAELLRANWKTIEQTVAANREAQAKAEEGGKKAPAKKSLPKRLVDEVQRLLLKAKAGDIALFGRMMASLPEGNVNAAAHVAHAFSTHAAYPESDYFITSDDLAADGEATAGMIGERSYSAATLYRYAAVDYPELVRGLEGDGALAAEFLKAFVEAFVKELPGGMQSSHAAYTLPEAVLLVAHAGEPRSLAGAFDRPVTAGEGGYTLPSIRALLRRWQDLETMYGSRPASTARWVALPSLDVRLPDDAGIVASRSIEDAIQDVVNAVTRR